MNKHPATLNQYCYVILDNLKNNKLWCENLPKGPLAYEYLHELTRLKLVHEGRPTNAGYKAWSNWIYLGRAFQTEETVKTEEPKVDMVNNPPHYEGENGITCIEAIEAFLGRDGFIAFLRGQVVKYVWRCQRKKNIEEDLKKSQWYLNKLLEVLKHGYEKTDSEKLAVPQ